MADERGVAVRHGLSHIYRQRGFAGDLAPGEADAGRWWLREACARCTCLEMTADGRTDDAEHVRRGIRTTEHGKENGEEWSGTHVPGRLDVDTIASAFSAIPLSASTVTQTGFTPMVRSSPGLSMISMYEEWGVTTTGSFEHAKQHTIRVSQRVSRKAAAVIASCGIAPSDKNERRLFRDRLRASGGMGKGQARAASSSAGIRCEMEV
jgi:hypothetical protein